MTISSQEISDTLARSWSLFDAARPNARSISAPKDRRGVSDIHYPWRFRENVHVGAAGAICSQWVHASGIIRSKKMQARYDQADVARLAALCYPNAPLDRLAFLARFFAWIFLEDDIYDNGDAVHDPEQIEETLNLYADILSGRIDGRDCGITARALGELREELVAVMPVEWMNRFCAAMEDFWFRGVLCESRLRQVKRISSLDDYMRMRSYSVAVAPVIQLIEFADGYVLPDALIFGQEIQEITWLTTRIIIYTNDIFSYEKERKLGDPNNYLYVLMHPNELDLSQALDHAVRAHDADLLALQAAISALPSYGSELAAQLQRYIEGHCAWIWGAFEWQGTSKRYQTSGSV